MRRYLPLLAACIVFLAPGSVWGQEKIKLEYKFTPGELLRYKLVADMNMDMRMSTPQTSGSPGVLPIRMVGIMRQRTKRVLPNGDAEVAIAFESVKLTMGGKTQELQGKQMPVITMITAKNGTVKKITGMEGMFGGMGAMQFFSPDMFGQCNVFPDWELQAGDRWQQQIAFPTGGEVRVVGQLLSTDARIGNRRVVTVKQEVGGSIGLQMAFPAADGTQGATNPNMTMEGDILGEGTVYFAVDKGHVVRSDGTANMDMKIGLSGGPNGQSGTVGVSMEMKYEYYLLP